MTSGPNRDHQLALQRAKEAELEARLTAVEGGGGGTPGVASFEGRTGAVTAELGDYSGFYSLTSHHHDATYATLGHNHDATYAALGHNHDAAYAGLGHTHDATYAALSHAHVEADITDLGNYTEVGHTHVEADITDLGSYALTTHNHDLDYAALGHNHDAAYATLGHNHDLDYAALSHNHDAAYAALGHNHDLDYAGLGHTHVEADITDLGSYALSTHNHDASYAALGHNHDAAYAALGHNHDASYAALGHNHDASYSALGHTHVEADITDLGSYALSTHNHTPAVAQRKDISSTALSTTPVTVPFAGPEILDSGWTFGSGVFTAGAALNGKRAVIDVMVACFNNNSIGRTQLDVYLYVGGTPVRLASNYATRDANQNTGTANINGYVTTLSTGTTIEVRAAATVDGGSPTLASQKSYITIRTLD